VIGDPARVRPRRFPMQRPAESSDRLGRIICESADPSGSRFNLRLAVAVGVVALRAPAMSRFAEDLSGF